MESVHMNSYIDIGLVVLFLTFMATHINSKKRHPEDYVSKEDCASKQIETHSSLASIEKMMAEIHTDVKWLKKNGNSKG